MTPEQEDQDRKERSLELDGSALRQRLGAALERIVPHIESLGCQPAGYDQEALPAPERLAEPLPQEGAPFEELLDLIFDKAAPQAFNAAAPGYLAYIPGGGLLDAAVGDLIADVLNRFTGVWMAAPLLVQLEVHAIRWLCDMLGLPPEAFGLLTSGGSMSNLVAVVAARQKRLKDGIENGVLYTSDQVHYSVAKAAMIAGFPKQRVVAIRTDDRQRIQLAALQEQIVRDRAAGLAPFFCAGSAGTVNTGAIDDLEALGSLCAREGLWFHVDGAYGGFFRITERGRRLLAGIEQADSIALDPHKGLFMPYGTGALLVRERTTLEEAFKVGADYLPHMEDDPSLVRADFCNLGPELSRPFRGLPLWLVLKLHGVAVFRRYLDEKLDLARYAAHKLGAMAGIEIVAEPALSLLAFRLARPGLSPEQLDGLNRELLAFILSQQRVWLSGTVLKGSFVLRLCVLSFRTHRQQVDEALELIQQGVSRLCASL